MSEPMNFVLTRTMTFRFVATSMNAAKKLIKSIDIIDEAECDDTLTCENTGKEELL